MQISDEIKAKLDIVELIREYVQLKPAGTNFQGLCPFHNEKSPSFVVSPEKQIWHCFGCSKGGDIFGFIIEKEGMTFVEALRFLAPKAGVVLQSGNGQNSNLKTRVLDVLEAAVGFYHHVLINHPAAQAARDYLEKRGLTDEVIEDWQIGFSLESWDDLLLFLKGRGFKEAEIDAAGLAAKGQSGNRFYNRFRGRIMFPIRDASSQTIAFTARQLPGADDKLGKYINSPATLVYDKSKVLFALDKAKQYIRQAGFAVIVEGQMDAITAHQFGFKNTVASSGTALTEEQLAMLGRFTDTVVLALDADQAGQAAAERAGQLVSDIDQRFIEQADRWGRLRHFIDPQRKYKVNIKIALVPSGKDPDEAIRHSTHEWQRALSDVIGLAEFYFQRSLVGLDLNKLDDRKKMAARFLPFAARLDDIERDYWIRQLSQFIDTDAKYLYEALARAKGAKTVMPATAQKPVTVVESRQLTREEALSQSLLALLIRFNAYIKYILDYVSPGQLVGAETMELYKRMIIYYNESKSQSGIANNDFALYYSNFKRWLETRELIMEARTLDHLAILAEKDYFTYSEAQADTEIKAIAKDLRKSHLNVRRRDISKLIAELERSDQNGNDAEIDGLVKELANLNEELRRLL